MDIFDKVDKKGKGELSYKAFIRCLKLFKVKFNPNNIMDIMLLLDMNESQTINKTELEIYMTEFFQLRGSDYKKLSVSTTFSEKVDPKKYWA